MKAVVSPISSFLGSDVGSFISHSQYTYAASVGLRGEGPFERAN